MKEKMSCHTCDHKKVCVFIKSLQNIAQNMTPPDKSFFFTGQLQEKLYTVGEVCLEHSSAITIK